MNDRRQTNRGTGLLARRRYPRVELDVDWFLDFGGSHAATFGRGLDISPRGARLPLITLAPLPGPASLYVALPGRARMFHARGTLSPSRSSKGLVVLFSEVSDTDLFHLGLALVDAAGVRAIPSLERRFARYADLPAHALRDSTAQ